MANLLITGTHGTDDPTRASLPFHVAKGAKEAGQEVAIVLAGDSPVVLKQAVRDAILGVGMPPMKDLFQFALDNGVRVYI
jgi:predicted peroxiredoxin